LNRLASRAAEKYTGLSSVCLMLQENIKIMLTEKSQFELMLGKPAADTKTSEPLISLTCDSSEVIKSITQKAVELGVRQVNEFEEN
jgi:predicted lactoylglutathione lyase